MPVVPTLSDRGWVRNTREQIDFLFAHYLESESSSNIQTAIMEKGHDIPALLDQFTENIRAYLMRYYQTVTLDIREDPNDDPNQSAINVLVDCTVVDETNQTVSVGMVLQSTNSRFKILTDINNYGTGNQV